MPTRTHMTVQEVRAQYDHLSTWYGLLVGDHIHHGYWCGTHSLRGAQVRLVKELAEFAAIPSNSLVLDVGCGLGGSAFWLAEERACSVLGITISPRQVEIATRQALHCGLGQLTRFEVFDASALDLITPGFDIVWAIECIEHLADRKHFFKSCRSVLAPGGKIVISGWIRPDRPLDRSECAILGSLCSSLSCFPLDRWQDYRRWLIDAGFSTVRVEDWTARVKKTADLKLERRLMRWLRRLTSRPLNRFLDGCETLKQAYDSGALIYAAIGATKES